MIAEYVAFYYIRTNFVSNNDNIIFPDPIQLLLATFLGCLLSDEWDPNSVNHKNNERDKIVIFGEEDKCIKRLRRLSGGCWGGYICGKKLANFSYKWRLKIFKCVEKTFGSLIGIVAQDKIVDPNDSSKILIGQDLTFRQNPYKGYAFWTYAQKIWYNDSERTKYGPNLHRDDIVEIELNMEQREISLIVNDHHQGIAFQNVPKAAYRLIVILYNHVRVQLLHDQYD